MMRYNPQSFELKWQKKWLKEKTYEPDLTPRRARGKSAREPFYNLMMFPYPSAEGLHVGNMYAFVGSDIYGRFKRMQGYDVFEPIGLDGFGIHSENYALKIGKHPVGQATISQENFYRQLSMIGNGFAWDEKLETYDPDYYKWTQWIFIQMFKNGLAYRKKAAVNWCGSCKTVLADEQVLLAHRSLGEGGGGECERCGSGVIKKDLEQWFFKITDYAERLLKNLEVIDWSEKVKIAQRNWIGRSEGALLKFQIPNSKFQIEVFTTRPDTLFGATYMVLAPEHPLIKNFQFSIFNFQEVNDYIQKAKTKTEEERIAEGREKTGVELKGVRAINSANKKEIPVFVADYVLGHVGTGAIMGVPAHDQRDFEFAKKFGLPVCQVIAPFFEDEVSKRKPGIKTVTRKTTYSILVNRKTNECLILDWGEYGWHTFIIGGVDKGEDPVAAAVREIKEETGYENVRLVRSLGKQVGAYFATHKNENRIADAEGFLFELADSKQNVVSPEHTKNHKTFWMKLDKVESFISISSQVYAWKQFQKEAAYVGDGILVDSGKFSGLGSETAKWEITKFVTGKKKVQYRLRDWLISRQRYWGPPIPMIFCEKCKWQPVPEKDLPVKLPFIKNFRPTGTDKSPLASVEKFYKVRCPKCKFWARRETDVSDTFLDSAWYFLRYPSVKNKKLAWDKPTTKNWLPVNMYIGGAEHSVLHLLYSRFLAMVFHDLGLLDFAEPFKKFRAHGLLIKDGAKMSKSKGNVVNPDEYVRAYGADALRMYLLFLGPFEQGGDFRDAGIRGITRFLERVWKLTSNFQLPVYKKVADPKPEIRKTLHKTIKKVTEDIEQLQYNTAISALMILLNELEANFEEVTHEHLALFLKLLAPFAPHMSEELWQNINKTKRFSSIHKEKWPHYDPKLIQEGIFELIVQVNGRVRGLVQVRAGITKAGAQKAALGEANIKRYITTQPSKVIFVPNKLINFVI